MRKYLLYFIALGIVVLDQLTKIIVRHLIPVNTSIPVLGDLFCLTHVENPNAAFSLSFFSNPVYNRITFVIITFLAVGLVYVLSRKEERQFVKTIYGLILGGALGNLLDRIFLGTVTDFLDSDFPDAIWRLLHMNLNRWPVFNVADSALCVAICLFIIDEFFVRKKIKNVSLEDK